MNKPVDDILSLIKELADDGLPPSRLLSIDNQLSQYHHPIAMDWLIFKRQAKELENEIEFKKANIRIANRDKKQFEALALAVIETKADTDQQIILKYKAKHLESLLDSIKINSIIIGRRLKDWDKNYER
jgi:hypothetical protein